jgi:hypothetical protein
MALISHSYDNELKSKIAETKERLISEGDKDYTTVAEELSLLERMSKHSLGQFLILNGGINGFWTDYIVNHEHGRNKIPNSERLLLENFPSIIATQQRGKIFQKILQDNVSDRAVMASIPCGVMGDLLNLDFSQINDFKLIGVDLDEESLTLAEEKAIANRLIGHSEFKLSNAWDLDLKEEVDILTSNGLNIYEPNADRVVKLYQGFHDALKDNGLLITSFLTPHPAIDKSSPWNFEAIDSECLRQQRVVFADIMQAKWQCFMSESKFRNVLEKAGFEKIEVEYDKARIFPTVTARKKPHTYSAEI